MAPFLFRSRLSGEFRSDDPSGVIAGEFVERAIPVSARRAETLTIPFFSSF